MGSQPESQQYKKPQVPPSAPGAKDDDFQKQGIDSGKKGFPAGKEAGKKPDADPDDDTAQHE